MQLCICLGSYSLQPLRVLQAQGFPPQRCGAARVGVRRAHSRGEGRAWAARAAGVPSFWLQFTPTMADAGRRGSASPSSIVGPHPLRRFRHPARHCLVPPPRRLLPGGITQADRLSSRYLRQPRSFRRSLGFSRLDLDFVPRFSAQASPGATGNIDVRNQRELQA